MAGEQIPMNDHPSGGVLMGKSAQGNRTDRRKRGREEGKPEQVGIRFPRTIILLGSIDGGRAHKGTGGSQGNRVIDRNSRSRSA